MFGECHAHVIMDGVNYRKAVQLHENGARDDVIRKVLSIYQKKKITFLRDGGDSYGVSKRAKELAQEYGIDYRTPIFAIHKEGHYGSIVGRSFENLKDFHRRVLEAKSEGADFIKIMTTGLLDFNNQGKITGTPLDAQEVKEMVHIAHEEGFAVMSHTNGCYGAQAAIEAGVDSLEHGNYMDEKTLKMLVQSNTIWVPTLVTVTRLMNSKRYENGVLKPIIASAGKNVKQVFQWKGKVALGSDAGAFRVPHGAGIQMEYETFVKLLGNTDEVCQWLRQGEEEIKERFQ